MNLFGIGIPELIMLVLLGTLLFGPEKIPEYSRKAARVVWFLRNVANNAQQQLRDELGPGYEDLELKDLNPKALVQKHVIDVIQDDINDIKSDLDDVKSDLDGELADARMLREDLRHDLENMDNPSEGQFVPAYEDAT